MEDLIKQAFLHIEVIGPHVAEGHYDLVGPNGDIILPQVWETVVEPDWLITMHMWPIPEKPKDPDPPPAADPSSAAPAKPAEGKKKEGTPTLSSKPYPGSSPCTFCCEFLLTGYAFRWQESTPSRLRRVDDRPTPASPT